MIWCKLIKAAESRFLIVAHLGENLFIDRTPIGKLRPHDGVHQIVEQQKRRSVLDFVGYDRAARRVANQAVFMVPKGQEKGELYAFIDKVNFFLRFALINDVARPALLEKNEIQFQRNHVAGVAAVEAHQLDGWKRRTKFFEEGFVETTPHGG